MALFDNSKTLGKQFETHKINHLDKKETITMTFDEMKKIVVDTLNCEEDKVTMEASLTEDLEADSLDAVELNMALVRCISASPSPMRSWPT